MKKIFITILLLSTYCISNSQNWIFEYAIVNDSDGYVFVRSSEKISNNIIDTLFNDDIVWCNESKFNNWISVRYGVNSLGYIHKSRLKLISSFDRISISQKSINTVTLSKDSINICITKEKFNNKNGTNGFGNDNGKAYFKYKSIIVTIGNRKIVFPEINIKNLFEPNLENSIGFYDVKNDKLYLVSKNSDGGFSYSIIWVIKNGQIIKQIETNTVI